MDFKKPRSLKRTLSKRSLEGCTDQERKEDLTKDMVLTLVKRLDDFLDSFDALLQLITQQEGSPIDLDGA